MRKILFLILFSVSSIYLGTFLAPKTPQDCMIEAKKVFLYLYLEDLAFDKASKCLDMAPECKKEAKKAISDMELVLQGLKTDLARCLHLQTPRKEAGFHPLPFQAPPWYNRKDEHLTTINQVCYE